MKATETEPAPLIGLLATSITLCCRARPEIWSRWMRHCARQLTTSVPFVPLRDGEEIARVVRPRAARDLEPLDAALR